MKILNEKGVIHFANSGAPADKEGYLHKKGDKEPLGVIVLEGCTIELAEDSDNFMFMINFASAGTRTYCLSAHSQESMESWMKALSCAGYEYIKLIVAELQHKLEEASNSTEANVVQAAARDGQILGRMYSNSNEITSEKRSSNTSSKSSSYSEPHKRVNPFDHLDVSSEMDPGDAFRPMTKISNVEIVTWQILQIHSFAEMHELVRQQIIEFSSENS